MTYDQAKANGCNPGSLYDKPDFGFWIQVLKYNFNIQPLKASFWGLLGLIPGNLIFENKAFRDLL